jgi:GTPase SAR1 family protein
MGIWAIFDATGTVRGRKDVPLMSSRMASQVVEKKVVVLGQSGAGKTSIVMAYVKNLFSNDAKPTIGASCLSKQLYVQVRDLLQMLGEIVW